MRTKGVAIILFISLCLATVTGCSNDASTPRSSESKNLSDLELAVKQSIDTMTKERAGNWEKSFFPEDILRQIQSTFKVQIEYEDLSIVSSSESEALVEVKYDVTIRFGGYTVAPTPPNIPGAEAGPQSLVQHYHATAEVTKSGGLWNVDNIFDGPPSEKLQTELADIQSSVRALLERAQATELDAAYDAVDAESEVEEVTALDGKFSLSLFYKPYKYPYAQSYDIDKDGMVAVHQEK